MNPITLTREEYERMDIEQWNKWRENYIASKYSSKRELGDDLSDYIETYYDYISLLEAITEHHNGRCSIGAYIELRSNIKDMLNYNIIEDAFYESLDSTAQEEGGNAYAQIIYNGILGTDTWFVAYPDADDNRHLSEIAYDIEQDELVVTKIF